MLNLFPSDARQPAEAIWIDLFNPTQEEIGKVGSALHIDIPARAELEEIESSSRLQFEDDTLQVSTPVSAHGDEDVPTPVGFVLTGKFLVTIRYTEMHAFEATAHLCNKKSHDLTSGEVFISLVEGMVDYGADMLEQIGTHLNDMSREAFRRYGKQPRRSIKRQTRLLREALLDIGSTGDRLSQIRESLLGLQRIAPFAREKTQGWMKPELQTRLKTIERDLGSLADFEVHLSNKVQFLLDAILGFINTEQNDIFKVLTIASVVGIPPTFIASMYGMNFHDMPEYTWHFGYEWGLFLIVLSTVLPIAWFKWRGWW
ncbi:MAG TPA: magnesium transporter CorA family protein [Rhizomicrobium sp.]|nr:magnesium transporter CorA family protein [Rhizomicrobium sp.]